MSTREEPGVILRRRLHNNKMTQADAARHFGKSRAWASQELFSDPQKTLRRLLIDQPGALDSFSKLLGWSNRDELLADMDVFEGTALQGAAPVTLEVSEETVPRSREFSAANRYRNIPRRTIEIPDALKEAAELYGHLPMYAGIRERRWQYFMASVSRKATPQDAEGWLREFSDLKRMDYDPEEPE